jgi:hypothetical protein
MVARCSLPAGGPLQPWTSRRAQLVEDRAVWPIVTLARFDQVREHLDDCVVRLHAGNDRLPVNLGQGANLAARTLLVAPEPQKLIDLLDRKALLLRWQDRQLTAHTPRRDACRSNE